MAGVVQGRPYLAPFQEQLLKIELVKTFTPKHSLNQKIFYESKEVFF